MRSWQARLLAVIVCLGCAAGQECGVEYSNNSTKPLLFGGVSSGCSAGCKPRDLSNYWADVCTYDPDSSVWGVCTDEQYQHNFEYSQTLGDGAVLQMSPCDIIPYLRGRTLWLLGDSHSKTLYRAFQCFLYDFWDHTECTVSPDPADVAALLKQPAAEGISNCFHLSGDGGGRICMIHTVLATNLVNNTEVAGGGVIPFLRSKLASPLDIFYINTGSWDRKTEAWGAAYQPALETLGQYYNSTKSEWPHLFFRETPALHPAAGNSCTPLTGYEYKPETGQVVLSAAAHADTKMQWANGATLNGVARGTLTRYGVPVTPAFNISAPLVDNHVGLRKSANLDCLHYCSPGVPEMWIWYLYAAMKQGVTGIKPLQLPTTSPGDNTDGAGSSSVVFGRDPGLKRQASNARVAAPTKTQQQLGPGQYVCNPSTFHFRH